MFYFLVGVLLSVLLYRKLNKPCIYWKLKDVLHVAAWPLVGSMGSIFFKKKHFKDVAIDIYNKFPNKRYVGFVQFLHPHLLIRDLDLIKQITVKDFNHFLDHTAIVESDHDLLLSKSLFALNGEKWRDMRATLSPAFTSSKMKNMYVLITECAENFVNHFQGEVELEMKDLFSKFANDVIATAAFGVQIDSLKDPNNDFFTMGTSLSQSGLGQLIKIVIGQISKSAIDYFGLEIFPKQVTTFFKKIIIDNIKKREKEGIIRPDMIHLLIEARKGKLKNESTKEDKTEGFATAEESQVHATAKHVELTDDQIVAQAMLFFLAGFDTVSTATSFMAYELAVNPDVQKKLQKEIDTVREKYQTKVPYEVLLSMKYLDQVISETLRLWPPGFQIDRRCIKDYIISPQNPDERQLVLEKGISVLISVMAIHRDPQYYPEPDRFDPERFSNENKSKIVPGSYLPFGMGPRNCIGSRFALMEIKLLFYHLLSKYNIVPVEKTMIPLKLQPNQFNLVPENGFWLGFKPRNTQQLS